MKCLALYGGPVDPALAFGGFLSPGESLSKTTPYHSATALIITFLVNNEHNKTLLQPALSWEQKLVQLTSVSILYACIFVDLFATERFVQPLSDLQNDQLDAECYLKPLYFTDIWF